MSTLYLTEPGSVLEANEGYFATRLQNQVRERISIASIRQIVLFDGCNLSQRALAAAQRRGIVTTFIGDRGYLVGRITPPYPVPYLSRQCDRAADFEFSEGIARSLLRARLHNSLGVLFSFYQQDASIPLHRAIAEIKDALEELSAWGETAQAQKALSVYYRALASVLPPCFQFVGRKTHPASDRINNLLELSYALLGQVIYAKVRTAGLHPEVGNLHHQCHNHLPLVCDLMEPLRPVIDRWLVDLVQQEFFADTDFLAPDERGGQSLASHALPSFIARWEQFLRDSQWRDRAQAQIQAYRTALLEDATDFRPLLL